MTPGPAVCGRPALARVIRSLSRRLKPWRRLQKVVLGVLHASNSQARFPDGLSLRPVARGSAEEGGEGLGPEDEASDPADAAGSVPSFSDPKASGQCVVPPLSLAWAQV